MKKTVRLVVFGVVATWTLPLMAILPPDAQFRRQEIAQQRMRARVEYEQHQKDYEKAMIVTHARTEAAMRQPPWMRTEGNKVKIIDAAELTLTTEASPKIKNRLLVSAVLLILIGAVVGWVRHVTREADK
jgi:hypothetical protein